MAGPLSSTQQNPMVQQASGGNGALADLMNTMLTGSQQRQSYLQQQQEAYNQEMEQYAQMVRDYRTPESTEAQKWGTMAKAAAGTAPMVGNLGAMLGNVGGAYGDFQAQRQAQDLKNQAQLTQMKQQEVRALEMRDQNAAMLRALGGGSKSGMNPTIKVVDGKLVKYDPLTQSTEVLTGSQDQIKKDLFKTFFTAAVKNEVPNPEEYATQQMEKTLAGFGGTTVKGEANAIPGVKASIPDQVEANAPSGSLKWDISGLSPEDKELALRVIERYKANPNEGTQLQAAKILNELTSNGRLKPSAEQPAAPSAGMSYINQPKREGEKESSKEGAKMYAESFNTDVLKPLQSFQDTARIMQDFNNLGEMNVALKNGKLKEFMAGETGKWAASFLPEGSDLKKGIANAQEAEKLTASMINKILLAAKGVQTEGDAARARSQVPAVGTDPEANKYIEAYINETANQLKLREQYGLAHKRETGNWEGYDNNWKNSPIMKDARGSVKRIGSQWIGLTQYIDKFKAKYPEATDADAVTSWNKVKP